MATLERYTLIQELAEDICDYVLGDYEVSIDMQTVGRIIDNHIGVIVESKNDEYVDLSIV